MKEKIEELEKGDLLWVSYCGFACKAKYLGKGIVKVGFVTKNFNALKELNWWIFRRKSLWGILKDILKK